MERDAGLDPSQRGLEVLGAPIGCDEFVRTQLHAAVVVLRGPSNLRVVRPRLPEKFVEAHDVAVFLPVGRRGGCWSPHEFGRFRLVFGSRGRALGHLG